MIKNYIFVDGGTIMPKKIKHKVEDIEKWKAEHENKDALRKQHGVESSSWIEDPKGSKIVVVTHKVTDGKKQKDFRKSEKGNEERKKAKVDGGEELEQ